jgi:predicted ATPase
LLVMLLLDVGRVVPLDRLIAGQYGDEPPAGAANAVQAQVSRLRKTLPAELIEHHGSGYRLVAEPEDVDVQLFERLARDGRRLLSAGQFSGAAALLREGLGLWRGSALVDLPHGEVLAARLAELRLGATEDLIEAELALPEGSSVAELRALVADHPLRERLRGQLMRALHAAGRQAEALAEFDAARRLLAEELGADPSAQLADTQLAILRAERAAAPGRQGPAAQFTSFVGRERELARLDELRDTRLVTILGPGGVGKTRLVVEAAHRSGSPACFVDLSPVDAGDQVPQAMLGALGLRESDLRFPVGDPVRRLVAALADGPVVIVDNCEQVIGAIAALVRTLLAECPGLTVRATSREPLGLTGETLLPLPPLDTLVSTDPAVRLFADRAAAVRPGFVVDPANAGSVVAICTALDGLPLAIELAAARLRQFTVAEVAARLVEHGRFRLLSRGDRTAAARHRTLHAVVEWSWDLLGADEQLLARRFAVFGGGAPADAVAAVCGVGEDVLADLVDKSLVETDGIRYRMLDTIRLFCVDQLVAAGELDVLRRAHARYHLDLAQRADPHLRRAEQLDWLARLSAEHDNLMAALRWSVRADRETAFRLVSALSAYWWLSGRRGQVGAAAAELLTDVPAGLAEEYVSCVVHAVPRADPEHWARASAIMRTFGRPLRHPFGAVVWGMAAGPMSQQATEAEPLLGNDPWNVALGRLSLALLGVLGGRPVPAEQELSAVLGEFRELGERWGTAQALDWLALVASWRGEWGRADELWDEALELLGQLGAGQECAEFLCHRAESRQRHGEWDTAAADYQLAAERFRVAGQPGVPPEIPLGLGEIALARGELTVAREILGEAWKSAQLPDFRGEWAQARVLAALGRLAEAAGEPGETVRRYRESVAIARSAMLASGLAVAAESQAAVAVLGGRGEAAALLLGVGVALRGMAVTGDAGAATTAAAAGALAGAAGFAEAYARGAAMSPEQALTVLDTVET